jgi:hypothetical protein
MQDLYIDYPDNQPILNETELAAVRKTMQYDEIQIHPDGNTYTGPIAQRFAVGSLRLPKVFTLSETDRFHIFSVEGDTVTHRASQSDYETAMSVYFHPGKSVIVFSRP